MWGLPSNAPVDSDMARRHPSRRYFPSRDSSPTVSTRKANVCTISSIASFARMMEWNTGLRHGARQVSRTASRSRFTASPWILLIGSVLSSTSRPEAGTSQLGEVSNHLLSQIEQRELAEGELQQLQRLDAIGQITSGVAHDLNNLLSVVLTNANLLLRNVRNPDYQEGRFDSRRG